jgi:hypothetical protein
VNGRGDAGAAGLAVGRRGMTSLPERTFLEIRPARSSDVDGVHTLYDGLDDGASYRRFFSAFRPRREFFERLVARSPGDGACLVAVVVDSSGDEGGAVIGEANYHPIPNGDGEWSLVCRPEWPWVAAVLLDELLATAADGGIPNLEADVLASDERMCNLIRGRQYATVPGTDGTVIRFVLGTRGDVPTWPSTGTARRVLVEGAPRRGFIGNDELATDETLALRCPGPNQPAQRCPTLIGLPCPLAADADVIVMRPTSASDTWSALREAHVRCHHRAHIDGELP